MPTFPLWRTVFVDGERHQARIAVLNARAITPIIPPVKTMLAWLLAVQLAACAGVESAHDRALIFLRAETIDTRIAADASGVANDAVLAALRKRIAGVPPAAPAAAADDDDDGRRFVLVHTRRVLRAAQREALAARVAAFSFAHYVPHNTWFVARQRSAWDVADASAADRRSN